MQLNELDWGLVGCIIWHSSVYTKVKTLWCIHKVQAPNYPHIWEEGQKEDGPIYGLMDGAC